MMPSIALRPYQQNGIDQLRRAFCGDVRRLLYVLPTGGGKTTVFAEIARLAADLGRRVAVVAHRRELVGQASRRLAGLGVAHGVVAPGWKPDYQAPVQVASVLALVKRAAAVGHIDLLVVDEAHHAVAGSWAKVLETWPEARVLGVTATPCRLDGRGLSPVFEHLVVGPSYSELIAQGYLTDCIVYAPSAPDMSAARRSSGDWTAASASEAMDRPTVTGDAVAHYLRLASGSRAVAFCAGVQHAQHVAQAFSAAGVPSACLHGKLDTDIREDVLARFAAGEVRVLTSCDIVSEGFDLPEIETAILLRPTQSLSLFLQQVGRVLRPCPGKERALVLDHAGNVLRHGWPTDDRDWSLEAGVRKRAAAAGGADAVLVRQCPLCYRVHRPSPACPACGHVYTVADRRPEEVAGELRELRRQQKEAKARRWSDYKRLRQAAKTFEDVVAAGESAGIDNPRGAAWHYARWLASVGRPLP